MKRSKTFWLQVCRMTCIGMSEQGCCGCKGPKECPANSDSEFIKYRELAIERMSRFMMQKLPPLIKKAIADGNS